MTTLEGQRGGRAWLSAGDVALPLILFTLTLIQPLLLEEEVYGDLSTANVAIGAATCLALLARRRWPLPALAATVAGALACVVVTGLLSPFWVAVAVAVYTVAARATPATALADVAAVLLGVVVLTIGVVQLTDGEWPWPHYFSLIAWPGIGGAAGLAVGTWRRRPPAPPAGLP